MAQPQGSPPSVPGTLYGGGAFITMTVVLLPCPTRLSREALSLLLRKGLNTISSPPAKLLKASACGQSAPCPSFLSWGGTQLPGCLSLSSQVLLSTSAPLLSPRANLFPEGTNGECEALPRLGCAAT